MYKDSEVVGKLESDVAYVPPEDALDPMTRFIKGLILAHFEPYTKFMNLANSLAHDHEINKQ